MPTDLPATLCAAFQRTVARDPDAVALRTPGDAVTLTWREYGARVRRIAAGLHGLGIRRGDTVGLMLANRPEFALVDAAGMHLGAAPFSVYNTSSAEQVAHLFGNAGNRVVVCESATLDVVSAAGADLDHVVCVDAERPGTLTLAALEAADEDGFDFDAAWRAVGPDDLATLIYTSGTTGPPKGVQTTHRHVLEQVRAITGVVGVRDGDRITSFLPSAHIADRVTTQYFGAVLGVQVTYVADARTIGAALVDTRPTIWFAVPRVWEKLKAALEAQVPGLDPASAPEALRGQLRAAIGLDRCRWAWSGAAAVAPETLDFFTGLDVPLVELWGMSEVTGAGLLNPPDRPRVGTVGLPLPGLETRLLDDGELLVRAPYLTSGYRGDPERTAEAIDAEGWLHTGDVACVDADGYVTIVDRKKEIIISAGGKNMSPANIESTLKVGCPLAAAITVVGDGRPYNVALVALDPDAAAAYAAGHGLAPEPAVLAQDPGLRAAVAAGIAAGNARLSRVEQVKEFEVLASFWEPGGDELTPTLKLRRRPIAAKYADVIDRLYGGPAAQRGVPGRS
ncbi:AMP-dependent synthetase/ligase [Nocardioides panacis]|uniref:Acyl-CoA synthetase n=1 Tax=Nocardioides panacis TaxID=2849501 RepID=A0A975XZR3_9ACTN|nr:AMP-binding protein [Nocardioides panacis]QWZ07702.1 AMP-dependent synthetase/ligase [Nocardioides panacis]